VGETKRTSAGEHWLWAHHRDTGQCRQMQNGRLQWHRWQVHVSKNGVTSRLICVIAMRLITVMTHTYPVPTCRPSPLCHTTHHRALHTFHKRISASAAQRGRRYIYIYIYIYNIRREVGVRLKSACLNYNSLHNTVFASAPHERNTVTGFALPPLLGLYCSNRMVL